MPLYFSETELADYLKSIPYHQGLVATKNKDYIYISANESVSKLTGFASVDELVGGTDFDLKCEAVKNALKFQENDKYAMTHKSDSGFLYFDHYVTGWRVLYANHVVICNQHDESIAVTVTGQPLILPELNQLGINLHRLLLKNIHHKNSFMIQISDRYPRTHLTKKQSLILFYCLHDFSITETVKALNISRHTVLKQLEIIKDQLGCQNQSQLLEKAFSVGLMDIFVPYFATDND